MALSIAERGLGEGLALVDQFFRIIFIGGEEEIEGCSLEDLGDESSRGAERRFEFDFGLNFPEFLRERFEGEFEIAGGGDAQFYFPGGFWRGG